jgi:hypothetical protein
MNRGLTVLEITVLMRNLYTYTEKNRTFIEQDLIGIQESEELSPPPPEYVNVTVLCRQQQCSTIRLLVSFERHKLQGRVGK